ncbi:MAG: hypothetical protein IJZ34_18655 [Lachnospiraceae bacterium]|nr:hypothetical protein [Lachnospiraceae bacterium]MBQ8233921.1 hypothetical protein [Lachnospiraceae bacterium]
MKITDLSLKEKILQTVVIRVDKDKFVSDQVGAAFFFGEIITEADEMGLDQARSTLKQYIDNAGIPILITSDFENGCGSMLKGLTPLPYLMGVGAANREEIAYNYGKATALEARSVGANWSFSPVSDLNINKRNPLVNVRGISDNPDLAIRLLKQVIRGMQENGLAACAKHFPGDGLDYRDQHIVTTNNSLSFTDWKKLSGKVFQELIDDGVYSVMAGHITLPDYQKEIFTNGMKLPATLSQELIEKLLKKEMGFEGVVVTDALGMGGFNGWYDTRQRSEIESFKAGCDMMLWPTADYVKNMTEAIENGYIPMERLDDAVSRILSMKEKLGLFAGDNHAITLSQQDRDFVKKTQQETAEHSVTLIRDKGNFFPINPEKNKKIAVIPITHHQPALEEAELLCEELSNRGFEVSYFQNGVKDEDVDAHDLVLYALFSRPFRPMGFLDFHSKEANKIAKSLQYGTDKTIVVSFGSPYFGNQYFERALTYVNAYSMLAPSVKAFVRAAVGEIPFDSFSPVEL